MSAEQNEIDYDLKGIGGDAEAAAKGIPFGSELMSFADAVASRDEVALKTARDALHAAAGDAVVVDAAGVAGNFQRMVRIADSMGIPVDDMANEMGKEIRAELNLDRFDSARNSGVGV